MKISIVDVGLMAERENQFGALMMLTGFKSQDRISRFPGMDSVIRVANHHHEKRSS